MEEVKVKVTWGLAWALFWRMMLIELGISAVIGIIAFIAGAAALIPFLGGLGGW